MGEWVGTPWTLPIAKTRSACLPSRGHSCSVLFWLLENMQRSQQFESNMVFGFILGQAERQLFENALLLPRISYPSGSASMSGIYHGLPRWVQACLCSSEMALYNLRNADERCLACPWWVREMDSIWL